MLRSGIVQSVACIAINFWSSVCVRNWVLIIPHSSTRTFWRILANTIHPAANKEQLGEKWRCILPTKYLCHTAQGSLSCRKILRHGADGFAFLLKEVVLLILSPLKIHRPRAALSHRTLGPMTSTITTGPPRLTSNRISRDDLQFIDTQWKRIYTYIYKLKC
jgi:hypothetical protein